MVFQLLEELIIYILTKLENQIFTVYVVKYESQAFCSVLKYKPIDNMDTVRQNNQFTVQHIIVMGQLIVKHGILCNIHYSLHTPISIIVVTYIVFVRVPLHWALHNPREIITVQFHSFQRLKAHIVIQCTMHLYTHNILCMYLLTDHCNTQ